MELIDTPVPMIRENPDISEMLGSLRSEITKAVYSALVRQAYNTDIELSFGPLHINEKGSVSQISFHGSDITDLNEFVVRQALHIGPDHYFDIRQSIEAHPEDFCYYPICINGSISFTVLKSSPYFEKIYGAGLHYREARAEYAAKYLIFYRNNNAEPDVYLVGLFGPEATFNTLLQNAGKAYGGRHELYYCYSRMRPELFLHLGQVKRDFSAYHPEKNPDAYNFYKGAIINAIFRNNKRTDENGKIKVRETRRICLQLIIQMQYGSVGNFCEVHSIDGNTLTGFLSGASSALRYTNGDQLTPSRLVELLDLPLSPDEDGLKDKNLLVRVKYDEIPEGSD